MSFPAKVFRILIASPSDVAEERETAVRIVQAWNDLHAASRGIVLLPLRWETHSAPEYGKRPQEIINSQVVDHCDLLVGIFWTRVGSPTGVAQSGTVEEIERVANQGKPVMLYFSQANQNPEKIDIDQLTRLRDFKRQTFPSALVESYSDTSEFREKLSSQLEIQLRKLVSETDQLPQRDTPAEPDIVLGFAESETGQDGGTELSLTTRFIELDGVESLPDFRDSPSDSPPTKPSAANLTLQWLDRLKQAEVNSDYYRQLATSVVFQAFFRPIRFWLKNKGSIGARDVHIELAIQGDASFVCLPQDAFPASPPSTTRANYAMFSAAHPSSPFSLLSDERRSWRTSIEVKALQPQRAISPEVLLFVGAKERCEISITATIFADGLPKPAVQELHLTIDVERLRMSAIDVARVPAAERTG
jgi:hypothetical protein